MATNVEAIRTVGERDGRRTGDKVPAPGRSAEMKEDDEDRRETIAREGIRYLMWAGSAGLFALAVYAYDCKDLSVAGVGIVVAGAALLIGGVLGLLFGIPRSVTAEHPSAPKAAGSESEGGAAQKSQEGTELTSYLPNTHLEQIADWLTKILVGVGLAEISSITLLGDYLKSGLGGDRIFAVSLSVYFVLCGFLIGFLWTRLYLPIVLRWSDAAARTLAAKVQKVGDDQQDDNEALNLGFQQLNPSPGLPAPVENVLKERIKNARKPTQNIIFRQAAKVRSDNWKDKNIVALTVPIFEALIASDSTNPEYHGQLGCALKDLERYDEAWSELDTAVTMHEQLKIGGEGPWYKFQRAVCRIHLDDNFKKKQPSDDRTKQQIADDLKVAWNSDLEEFLDREGQFLKDWIVLNGLKGAAFAKDWVGGAVAA